MKTDHLKAALGDLGAEAAKSVRADHRIMREAQARHAEVMARLDELRPKTLTDPDAADEYAELTEERGQLELVLGAGE